jgi:hypothetical protein
MPGLERIIIIYKYIFSMFSKTMGRAVVQGWYISGPGDRFQDSAALSSLLVHSGS